ncbi:MAG: 50S ribosomal protein L6 [Candidatus Pacebacteria bacterium]|nr:50S ribosomal protein L6 [Candidatus Paceibacterota bacterium]
MSRIGKKEINIPNSVEVVLEESKLKVKGSKGEDFLIIKNGFKINIKDNALSVIPLEQKKDTFAQWGTLRALINNLIIGVDKGFEKQLEVNGVGYRADIDGANLNLKLGYSHPIILSVPEGLDVKVEKNIITISGISKEKVGQFAAKIKFQRPVEPYKGKGIHYVGEKVLRKAGKRVATTA